MPFAAAGLACLITVVAGGAVAASTDPLSGIGAAEGPVDESDHVSAAVAAQLKSNEQPPGTGIDRIGERLVEEARLLGELPDGHKVYVVPTSKGKLCIVVAEQAESCGEQLSRSRPITMTVAQPGPGVPPIVWGATIDDVVSVSFAANGSDVSVPVRANFYLWQGSHGASRVTISTATARFADGSRVVVR
jgi:hypothetical protein